MTLLIDSARLDEVEELLGLERRCWVPTQQFTRENFQSQMGVFQEGMLTARLEDELVGMFILTRVDYNLLQDRTWNGVSDQGNLVSTFAVSGDTVYGVSLSVSPDHRRQGIGRALVLEAQAAAQRWGCSQVLVGSRIPSYHLHQDVSVRDYAFQKADSQVRFYASCGLEVLELLPGYFADPPSLDYGVLMGRRLA